MNFSETQKYIEDNTELAIKMLSDFVQTDTLLFLCPQEEIKQQQKQKWLPLIAQINQNLSTVFKAADVLNVLPENVQSAKCFEKWLRTLSLKQLTVIYLAATNLKSPLLSYVFIQRNISAKQAFDLAYLEELYQNEKWGEDDEAVNRRQKVLEVLLQIEAYIKNDQMFNC